MEDNITRELHATLVSSMVAPITENSPQLLQNTEHVLCGATFEETRRGLAISLNRLVSLELVPATKVIMEHFSKEYAKSIVSSSRSQERLANHFDLGSLIGLTVECIRYPGHQWEERDVQTVTSLAQDYWLITEDSTQENRFDPIVENMLNEFSEHLCSDIATPKPYVTATKAGYHTSRTVAKQTIKPLGD